MNLVTLKFFGFWYKCTTDQWMYNFFTKYEKCIKVMAHIIQNNMNNSFYEFHGVTVNSF